MHDGTGNVSSTCCVGACLGERVPEQGDQVGDGGGDEVVQLFRVEHRVPSHVHRTLLNTTQHHKITTGDSTTRRQVSKQLHELDQLEMEQQFEW